MICSRMNLELCGTYGIGQEPTSNGRRCRYDDAIDWGLAVKHLHGWRGVVSGAWVE